MKYGSNLRKLRSLRGYSQKRMALALGMSQSNYDKIEKDKIKLSSEKLQRAANELGVSVYVVRHFDEDLCLNAFECAIGDIRPR